MGPLVGVYAVTTYGPLPIMFACIQLFAAFSVTPPFAWTTAGSTAAETGAARVERTYEYDTGPKYPYPRFTFRVRLSTTWKDWSGASMYAIWVLVGAAKFHVLRAVVMVVVTRRISCGVA